LNIKVKTKKADEPTDQNRTSLYKQHT